VRGFGIGNPINLINLINRMSSTPPPDSELPILSLEPPARSQLRPDGRALAGPQLSGLQ
jgi:hypothetical protein